MQTIPANGADIPTIGLGTWPMRGEECARAVAAAIGLGYRHIDTAASYRNEDGVGEGARASGVPRDQLFITTKIPHSLVDGPFQRSLENSLKHLGMDYVDLALIHWPSQHVPMSGPIAALNEVKRSGLARNIGVSNFTAKHLAEAWAVTREPLAVNQCEFHPYVNQDRVIAACRDKGMAFVAYSPLGHGLAFNEPVIVEAARRHGRSVAQIILRWEVQHQGAGAIPKSSDPNRMRDNLDVFSFALDDRQMQEISALTRLHPQRIFDSSWITWDR